MALKRLGTQSVKFDIPPSVYAEASIVGKKEGEGPLRGYFDKIESDPYLGQSTWEKAESELMLRTVNEALKKGSLSPHQIDFIFAGDLLNQSIGSNYGLRDMEIPFFGVFGACSTMAETLSLGAMLIDGGFAEKVICTTSSHFCSAEKQFRYPLEYSGQRPPTAQWTVTGCGAVILSKEGIAPYITHVTVGKIKDLGIKDATNMGAAMAPAFVETITSHFKDTNRDPSYYDLILSGDLGSVGKSIAIDLLKQEGYDISSNYNDCGCMIFDNKTQDTHAGGSGCGCSASVLCAYVIPKMRLGELKRVLFIATGALMSPTSTQQGESIPSIAHAVALET